MKRRGATWSTRLWTRRGQREQVGRAKNSGYNCSVMGERERDKRQLSFMLALPFTHQLYIQPLTPTLSPSLSLFLPFFCSHHPLCQHTFTQPPPPGKWTVQQAAELSVAAPTITASLDGRYMSACKEERVEAAKFYEKLGLKVCSVGFWCGAGHVGGHVGCCSSFLLVVFLAGSHSLY